DRLADRHDPLRAEWSQLNWEFTVLCDTFHAGAAGGDSLRITGAGRFDVLCAVAGHLSDDYRLLRLVCKLNNICPRRRIGPGGLCLLRFSGGPASLQGRVVKRVSSSDTGG